ncbi:MAG: PAS domain S-box protein [Chloroflexi bacterium CFX4]|nr:PAS domain S-box protein [Chloroflexi bacterium CFX4]MDL1923899.1 PAS domain S-box protein [Chloroflexi bacterium CFX3]
MVRLLSAAHIQTIHECSKDAVSFQRLMALCRELDMTYPEEVLAIMQPALNNTQPVNEYALYRALFDHTDDSVVLFTANDSLRIFMVNRRACELFGCTEEDLIGLHAFDLVAPEERSQSFQKFDAILADERLPLYQRTMRRKDGSYFKVEVSACLIRDAEGNPLYIQSVVRDIGERLRTEQRERELLIERERVTALQNIIRDLAHDLNTPITVVRTSTYLLNQLSNRLARQLIELSTQLPTPYAQAQLTTLHQTLSALLGRNEALEMSTLRLQRLIESLLDMALLDSRLHFRFSLNDVNSIVSNVCESEMLAVLEKGVALVFTPDLRLPLAHVDAYELARAVRHIVQNALQFTPKGGRVEVTTQRCGTQIVIKVADNGMGIPAEIVPRLFDRFFRADYARQSDTGGMGLGLPIAQKIIEGHGGSIIVESTPGSGSTFTLFLPISGIAAQ